MQTDYEIAIVGGGLTALSAALTAARLGHNVAVIARDIIGGHLLNIERIDGYPGFPAGIAGYELIPALQEQTTELGVSFLTFDVSDIENGDGAWRIAGGEDSITASAVIVATGAYLRHIGLPNEEAFAGSGISHCAACDGPLYSGKSVIVVGGGDSGLQEALKLADFASHVTVIEHGNTLTAQAMYQDEVANNPAIEVKLQTAIEEILGDATVSGVKIQSHGETGQLEAAGIFPFVGLAPDTAFLKDAVKLNDSGAIIVDQNLQSSAPGLFAAGTCRAGSSFRAVSAAGDGATAATSAHIYLQRAG